VTDRALGRRPVPVQSAIAALEKQAQHGVGVPGVDLGHPLGGHAVFGEITIGPVMKDHLRARCATTSAGHSGPASGARSPYPAPDGPLTGT
jgi:hypothetical protein